MDAPRQTKQFQHVEGTGRLTALERADVGRRLFTPSHYDHLVENGKRSAEREAAGLRKIDYHPVVKLIDPVSNSIWLISEINPARRNMAVGLIDLGMGTPEIGDVDLRELVGSRRDRTLAIRTDSSFKSAGRLTSYAQTAKAIGRIIA